MKVSVPLIRKRCPNESKKPAVMSGIALDGDADRVIMADTERVYDGGDQASFMSWLEIVLPEERKSKASSELFDDELCH